MVDPHLSHVDGQFAGEGYGPDFEHWIEPIWSPGADSSPGSGDTRQGLRVAAHVDACLPDCNADQSLNVLDLVCFQQLFAAGSEDADLNGDGVLSVLDFIEFHSLFMAGCPKR